MKGLWNRTFHDIVTGQQCLNKSLSLIGCGDNSCVASSTGKTPLVFKVTEHADELRNDMAALKVLDGLDGHTPTIVQNKKVCSGLHVMGETLVKGINLSKRMQHEHWYTLPPTIDKDILHWIAAMHTRGVVHLDAHDNNFLIGATNVITIIDFGESQVLARATKTKAYQAFTAHYPEIDVLAILKLCDYLNLWLALVWFIVDDMPPSQAAVDPAPYLRRHVQHGLATVPHFLEQAELIHATKVFRLPAVLRRAFPVWETVLDGLGAPFPRSTAEYIIAAFR